MNIYQINKDNNGTKIGLIFTFISFLLTFTFVVPMLSMIPGAAIESVLSAYIENEPYSNVGKASIITFLIFLVASLSFILYKVRVQSKVEHISNTFVVGVLLIEYFVVHPLAFYIYWAVELDFRSDGQLIFASTASFPFSSLSFVFIGLLIDKVKCKVNLLEPSNK